jgi:hypothetical protein
MEDHDKSELPPHAAPKCRLVEMESTALRARTTAEAPLLFGLPGVQFVPVCCELRVDRGAANRAAKGPPRTVSDARGRPLADDPTGPFALDLFDRPVHGHCDDRPLIGVAPLRWRDSHLEVCVEVGRTFRLNAKIDACVRVRDTLPSGRMARAEQAGEVADRPRRLPHC